MKLASMGMSIILQNKMPLLAAISYDFWKLQ